jgi:hypothetical protein
MFESNFDPSLGINPLISEKPAHQEPKVIIWGDKGSFPTFYQDIFRDPSISALLTDSLSQGDSSINHIDQALSSIQKKLPHGQERMHSFKELIALVGVKDGQLVWLAAAGELTRVAGDLFEALGLMSDFNSCEEVMILHTHPSNKDVIGVKGMGTIPLPGWSLEDKKILSMEGNKLKKYIPPLETIHIALLTAGSDTSDGIVTSSAHVDSNWGTADLFS